MTKIHNPNDALRRARIEKGWTQRHLAEQIGTNQFTVARWEAGVAFPSPYFRRQLCEVFAASPEVLGMIPTEITETIAAKSERSYMRFAVPASLTPDELIGRDALLDDIRRILCADPPSHQLALYGMPGVGKTTLASVLAHDSVIQERFPDGVLWIGLGPNPQLVPLLNGWGMALGVPSAELAQLTRVERLIQALQLACGNRRFLFIIDDVWQIEDALNCKVGGSSCTHLVTTRSMPIAFHFAPSHAIKVPELYEEQGIHLLTHLAPEAVALEPTQAQELVQRVGGLPLALSLVGRYLQSQSLSKQPRRIRTALEKIRDVAQRMQLAQPYAPTERPPNLKPDAPYSLQMAIAASEEVLPDTTRHLFHTLSVFAPKPSSFTEDAAHAASGMEIDDFVSGIDMLTDSGLIESTDAGRYTIHQSIADYLHLSPRDAEAERRMAGWYVAFCESYDRPADYQLLDSEIDNILLALDHARNQDLKETYVRGVIALANYLRFRGLTESAYDYLKYAYEMANSINDPPQRARVLLFLARMAEYQGKYDEAETAIQEGIVIANSTGEVETYCDFYLLLGVLNKKHGDAQQAQVYWEQGLTIARNNQLHKRICGILVQKQR